MEKEEPKNEEEKPQEDVKEKPKADSGEGSKPTTTPLIDGANVAAQRLEEANKRMEENLARQEQLMASNALGGVTDAGQKPAEKKKLTDDEYGAALMKGDVNPLVDDGFI